MFRAGLLIACGLAFALAGEPAPESAESWVVPDAKPVPPSTPKPAAEESAGTNASVAPAARLDVFGPEAANVGQPAEYRLAVTNTGTAPLHRVRVEDELPEGARYLGGEPAAELPGGGRLVWELGTLEPGQERRIRIRVRPADDGELRSSATVSFAATARVVTPITKPRLMVRVDAPETAVVGSEAVFPVEVRNAGNGPANRVVLQVRLPDGLSHPAGDHVEANLGTLDAGASRTVTLKTTARRTGPQTVAASIFGEGRLRADAKASVRVTEPALELRTDGPRKCPLGGGLTLALEASNPGSAPTGPLRLRAQLPDGVAFGGASHAGTFDAATNTVVWSLPSLEAGSKERLACECRAVTLGAWPGRVSAEAGRLKADAGWRVEVVGVAMPAIEVGLDEEAVVGHECVAVVRAVNSGTGDCTRVRVKVVGDGLEFVDGTAGEAHASETTLPPREVLAAGADALFRVRCRPTRPGAVTLRAELECEEGAAVGGTTVRVPAPSPAGKVERDSRP